MHLDLSAPVQSEARRTPAAWRRAGSLTSTPGFRAERPSQWASPTTLPIEDQADHHRRHSRAMLAFGRRVRTSPGRPGMTTRNRTYVASIRIHGAALEARTVPMPLSRADAPARRRRSVPPSPPQQSTRHRSRSAGHAPRSAASASRIGPRTHKADAPPQATARRRSAHPVPRATGRRRHGPSRRRGPGRTRLRSSRTTEATQKPSEHFPSIRLFDLATRAIVPRRTIAPSGRSCHARRILAARRRIVRVQCCLCLCNGLLSRHRNTPSQTPRTRAARCPRRHWSRRATTAARGVSPRACWRNGSPPP